MDTFLVYREPNILLLRGIAIADLIDDTDDTMFDSKYTEELGATVTIGSTVEVVAKASEVQYSSIPKEFYSWKTWISSTNLACWNCDRFFKSVPIFIVGYLHVNGEGKRVIDPEGNFCTDNCAQNYIDMKYTGVQHDDKTKYQIMLRQERLETEVILIKAAEPKTCMKKYIGPSGCTPEEYGKRLEALDSEFSIHGSRAKR